MAGDLIPPPSPAGRPGEDPERHRWLAGAGATRAAAEPAATPAEAPGEPRLAADSPYRTRFGFLFGALIGLAIAAAVLGTMLFTSGDGGDDGPWSAWKPTSEKPMTAAQQIADHVAPKYRLKTGEQLVMVKGGPLEASGVPLDLVVREGGTARRVAGEGEAVMYTMNGLGPRGSIAVGKPSAARKLLAHREALELALLTFHYSDDVDTVVSLLPPSPPEKGETVTEAQAKRPMQALLFRRDDLEPHVEAPSMGITVAESPTPRPETLGREAQRVDALTTPFLHLAQIQQAQDASVYLVLDRVG